MKINIGDLVTIPKYSVRNNNFCPLIGMIEKSNKDNHFGIKWGDENNIIYYSYSDIITKIEFHEWKHYSSCKR